MKKIILLVIMTLFLTGCTIDKMEDATVSRFVDIMNEKDIKLNNRSGIGYSYYIPNNVKLLEVTDDNEVLYSEGNNYYLYVDLISYQKKVKNKYTIDKTAYLSKEIKNDKKFGYIQIDKVKNQYFIEMVYNYAKIEAYVYEYQLDDAIINISYILSSIKYNDKIIESLVTNKIINNSGVKYDIFKPGVVNNNYLDNIDASLIDTSRVINDSDIIKLNIND